ncbi:MULTISPECIES: lysozyme inhibitor LprI family protein [unclassified Acinetobacter]|uniref:lysozyme inhibitor LprI family protein n=1 Tax=unclassified Acinetobacter TaxID=196816 RepID=UPI0018ABA1AA|nr:MULTISPECIES: lysozyme inhibitor LprI family protein [unclassified Acinetobacter]MBJ9951481.1 DUF1311 domain-containing protein [Acinetobacter baumannii]
MLLKYWGLGLILILPMHAQAMGYSAEYVKCMNSAGTGSTSLANCMQSEFSKQDDRLKSLFKQTLALYSDKEKKAQKKYQKQWLKQRSQQCDKDQKSVSDDYKMKYYNCALKQTVNRANSLEKLTYRL